MLDRIKVLENGDRLFRDKETGEEYIAPRHIVEVHNSLLDHKDLSKLTEATKEDLLNFYHRLLQIKPLK